MSDRVHELIDTLKEKVILLKDQYAQARSKNDELTQENEQLKAQLTEKSMEISTLQSKVESLEEAQNSTIVQNVNPSDEERISDDKIDELVREIEYCIGQLKK